MAVETSGAEWKAFLGDDSFWPEGAYCDDWVIVVDGTEYVGDVGKIEDSAKVVIECGVVMVDGKDSGAVQLTSFFNKWREWAAGSLNLDLDARTMITLDGNVRRHEAPTGDFDLVYTPKTRTLEVVLYKYLHLSEYDKKAVFAVSSDDVLFDIVTVENAANYKVIDRFTREVPA